MRNYVLIAIAACAASFMIASCGINPSVPTPAQLTSADYGVAPTSYENAIHQYFDATLKDPGSVNYRQITEPEKGFLTSKAPISGIYSFEYGWIVKASVNAKNSYGGYVGFKIYTFLFRGEQITDSVAPSGD